MNWGVAVLEDISNGCDFYKYIHLQGIMLL